MTMHVEFIKAGNYLAEVIRTDRKKTASVFVKEGKVSVVVPVTLTDSRIEDIVVRKSRWIREKLQIQRQSSPVKPKEYISGESFSYLGKNYRLKVESGSVKSVKLKNGRIVVQVLKTVKKRAQYVQGALIEWYQEHALLKLQEKVERCSNIIGVNPESVGIRTFQSRWGSCSAKGHIQYNWKIIMAPNRIVDYIVVHELCHLKQHNHSPKFWKSVERVIPDYLECKEWLKMNSKLLDI